jgi:hypothetical protein
MNSFSSKTAFVSGAAVLARPSAALAVSTFTSSSGKPAIVAAKAKRAVIVTMVGGSQKEESPFGFTLKGEQVQGRLAMAGFLLAIVTEYLNPTHPGIIAQVGSLVQNAGEIAGIF